MINNITKYISKPPMLLQIAKDDIWEDTWNIDLSQEKPTAQKITGYLQEKEFNKIAVELLFQEEKQKVYILGLVFNNHLLIKEPQDFLTTIINEACENQDFASLINNLDQKLIGKKYLLRGSPEIIRIGIVNHWFSVGPVLIWQKGQKKEMSDDFLQRYLLTRPEITRSNLNYLGLAFIYNPRERAPGLRHWIKAPCSRPEKDDWVLDKEMVYSFLKELQNFTINKFYKKTRI